MFQDRITIFQSLLDRLPRLSLVDLGAGHCEFAQIAYKRGFPVTAIDARRCRVPSAIEFPFLEQDVREADLSPYRIVCILGLLYHLPLNDQIGLLLRCLGKIVIVDTHCAQDALIHPTPYYEGELWEEVEAPTSSWKNRWSFWHTEPSLRRLFANCRFEAEKIEPEHAPHRAFWLLNPKDNYAR